MSKAVAIIRNRSEAHDALRAAIVTFCAAALMFAGQAFPVLTL